MLDVLSERLNFTYSVISPDLSGAGADGTSYTAQNNQMLEQVQQHQVFMAVGPFVTTEEVVRAVILSETIDLQQYTIMYRRPQELSRTTLFIRPLTPFVSTIVEHRVVKGFEY